MNVNRDNVYEVIDNYLKENKIRFSITPDGGDNFYELFLGSESGFIQIETNLNDSEDKGVFFQFFSKVDNYGNSLYHSQQDTDDKNFDLIGEIEELITNIKKLNQVIGKIQNKLDDIKNICEENEMNVEDFIEIIYDFNK